MICNLTGYRFFAVPKPLDLQKRLKLKLQELDIRGTILVAEEGINFSISVADFNEKDFLNVLKEETKQEIPIKKSPSESHPHKRFLVKVRPEIVTIRYPHLNPACSPAPYIEAKELKRWMDEGREFLLLDTRKKFEFEIGSFEKAINLGGKHFEDFPEEVEQYLKGKKDQTVVTFCTGGIRCEKGAPMMQQKGFRDVFQLKGGILQYFEECGGAHWRGNCFVFDHRAALRPDLEPAKELECRACGELYDLKAAAEQIDGLRLLCVPCYEKWRSFKDRGEKWAYPAEI